MDYARLVQDVLDGNESALRALAVLKEQKDFIESCLTQIEEDVKHELGKYEEKKFLAFGYNFEKRPGGVMYNFKNISEWSEKNAELKRIEDKYKAAYDGYKKGLGAITIDGEVLALPEVSYRKDSVIIRKA